MVSFYRLVAYVYTLVIVIRLTRYSRRIFTLTPSLVTKYQVMCSFAALGFGFGVVVFGTLSIAFPAAATASHIALLAAQLCVLSIIVAMNSAALAQIKRVRPVIVRPLQHLWSVNMARRVTPLWRMLTTAIPGPGVALDTHLTWVGSLFRPERMALLLRRRVQEILDARRRLGVIAPTELQEESFLALPDEPVALTDVRARAQRWRNQFVQNERFELLADQEAERLMIRVGADSALDNQVIASDFPESYEDQVRFLCLVSHAFYRRSRTKAGRLKS